MQMLRIIPALLLTACAAQPKAATVTPVTAAAESNIEVCVVDTIAPGGMMEISAIAVPANHDTVVIQPEGRVAIGQLTAGPKVLSQAAWISTKQPLTLSASGGRVVFRPSGSPRAFTSGQVALLGMMRGTPVFAKPAEGGAMRAEVEALAARGVDLEKALSQRASLRKQIDKINSLYIPSALVGCVFQQFNRVTRRAKA
jgi:hypothetical protein